MGDYVVRIGQDLSQFVFLQLSLSEQLFGACQLQIHFVNAFLVAAFDLS